MKNARTKTDFFTASMLAMKSTEDPMNEVICDTY
jgi:hypothetical protein